MEKGHFPNSDCLSITTTTTTTTTIKTKTKTKTKTKKKAESKADGLEMIPSIRYDSGRVNLGP